MKMLKRLGSVLMIVAVMLAFAPMTFDSEVYAASIKLNKKTVYMLKGKTYQLKVKNISKAAVKKVKWKSSDTKIVKVSKSGKLTSKNYGSATVTAKYKGKTLRCKVVVERKAERNARKLRNYLLEKGKKSKKYKNTKYIQLKVRDPDVDEGTTWTYRISANTRNKALTFSYDRVCAEPPEKVHIKMTINLVSGSPKIGTVEYQFDDGYGIETWTKIFAEITTGFFIDAEDIANGITVTQAIEHDGDGEEENYYEITDPDQIAEKYLPKLLGGLRNAFKGWDKLMSCEKPLKKAGIKMNTIGFSKL